MNNREVAHQWANLSDRDHSGSHFYHEGRRIYSYGPHYLLGKLFPATNGGSIALINSAGYSSTTAKHKSYAIHALSSAWTVISVPCPEAETNEDHKANIAHMIEEQKKLLVAVSRAKSRMAWVVENLQFNEGKYRLYCQRFNIPLKRFSFPMVKPSDLAKYRKQAETNRAKAELLSAEREERKQQQEAKDLEAWKNGADIRRGFYHSPIALRFNNTRFCIETSRGAVVPVTAALKLAKRWIKNPESIIGEQIDSYTVNAASAESVTIGCHTISAEEIKRLFFGTKGI